MHRVQQVLPQGRPIEVHHTYRAGDEANSGFPDWQAETPAPLS
jgi:hypothetical protein